MLHCIGNAIIDLKHIKRCHFKNSLTTNSIIIKRYLSTSEQCGWWGSRCQVMPFLKALLLTIYNTHTTRLCVCFFKNTQLTDVWESFRCHRESCAMTCMNSGGPQRTALKEGGVGWWWWKKSPCIKAEPHKCSINKIEISKRWCRYNQVSRSQLLVAENICCNRNGNSSWTKYKMYDWDRSAELLLTIPNVPSSCEIYQPLWRAKQ